MIAIRVYADGNSNSGLTTKWEWLEATDLYDCVCGISYKDKPIGVGVFFDLNLVLTSATPIEPYLKDLNAIKIHAIHGAYDQSKTFPVTCATTPYDKDRKDYWLPIGMDDQHSGIHDLMVLYAESPKEYQLAPEAVNASYRHAFSSFIATTKHRILPMGFDIPGFGFVDEDHVMRMNDVEAEVYHQSVLVDCDDYIPRDWGRFICIANLRNTTGVQSGSPLMQRSLIYGIGNFALEKGEDKIFVFTDIRDYIYHLHYCEKKGEIIKWQSRYWKIKK